MAKGVTLNYFSMPIAFLVWAWLALGTGGQMQLDEHCKLVSCFVGHGMGLRAGLTKIMQMVVHT